MCHKDNVRKVLPVFSILLTVLFNQPINAHAFADLHSEKGHHDEKSSDQGDNQRHDGDKRDQHQDQRQDQPQDQHQDEHRGQ